MPEGGSWRRREGVEREGELRGVEAGEEVDFVLGHADGALEDGETIVHEGADALLNGAGAVDLLHFCHGVALCR